MIEEQDRWDAIVVGSGMGGLACASLLAQLRGLRVLVLERHWRLGGFTHEFVRPAMGPWPVGLHYVGQMGEGDPVRALMDLVTGHGVEWRPMPDPFERFHFPSFDAVQLSDAGEHQALLVERWPEEADAVARWFAALDAGYEWFAQRMLPARAAFEQPRARHADRYAHVARATTHEILDASGLRSPELRAVLTAQWGNYGLPPRSSAFVAHAVVARHFRDGGWFPADGCGSLAGGARTAIEAAGGACLTSHEVERVLVVRGRAAGVRVLRRRGHRVEEREFLAPLIVSDIGARATCSRLLPPDTPGASDACRQLDSLGEASSAVQLFLALGESPACIGARGENHWMFAGCDHDALHERRNDLAHGRVATAYLSFPSLKLTHALNHTAELVAPLDHGVLDAWTAQPWRRRGSDYEAVKQRIADALLDEAERRLPGLRSLVTYAELGTPLTVERFTGHAGGAIYGLPPVPRRYALACLHVATPMPGLLLTGSDVATAGVVGALMGGVATAGHVLGPGGVGRVLAAARGRSTPAIARTGSA